MALMLFLASCSSGALLNVPVSAVAKEKVVGAVVPPNDADNAVGSAVEAPVSNNKPLMQQLESARRPPEKSLETDSASKFPNTNALVISAESMPLRDLLNYAFGDLLKVPFVVTNDLPGLDQSVTLNAQKPLSSRALFKMLSELLMSRGITILEKERTYFITSASGKNNQNIPIGIGRNPSDVPDVPGVILQVVPLKFGGNASIERTLRDVMQVQASLDSSQGALFVTGERPVILRVIEMVRLFDQPALRSSRIGMVNLTYLGNREFIEQVTALLSAEGIQVGSNANLSFVSLDQAGSIVVFAANPELLERVEFWARQIDRPSQGPTLRYFFFQPKFARATDIGEGLAAVLGSSLSTSTVAPRDTRSALNATNAASDIDSSNVLRRDRTQGVSSPSSNSAISVQGDGVKMTIDPKTNSLVFYTTGTRYQSLLPLLARLDITPRQIALEATLAEVTLTGEFSKGVEYALSERRWSGATNLGLPSGGIGLSYFGSLTDQFRLRLSENNGQIRVLSRPTLIVRDNSSATISVGNDVPTVGATATDPLLSNRQVTTVLYRKTGLKLIITPAIAGSGIVTLKIEQSIANTVPGSSELQGAPVFFERSVQTEVVAQSGQSLLFAGLISESNSYNAADIPFIGRVPVLGNLFRSDGRKREKTELVLLITPKVIENAEQSEGVLQQVGRSFGYLGIAGGVDPLGAAPGKKQ